MNKTLTFCKKDFNKRYHKNIIVFLTIISILYFIVFEYSKNKPITGIPNIIFDLWFCFVLLTMLILAVYYGHKTQYRRSTIYIRDNRLIYNFLKNSYHGGSTFYRYELNLNDLRSLEETKHALILFGDITRIDSPNSRPVHRAKLKIPKYFNDMDVLIKYINEKGYLKVDENTKKIEED